MSQVSIGSKVSQVSSCKVSSPVSLVSSCSKVPQVSSRVSGVWW